MGVDSNGCWMGNWCQDMSLGDNFTFKPNFTQTSFPFLNLFQGGCPDVTMVSKRGFMEKKKAMAHRAERQFIVVEARGSGFPTYGSSDYGSDYGFDYGSGSGSGFFTY